MQIFGGSNSNGTGYRWAEAADNVALSSAAGLGVPSVSITTPPDYEETMHRRTRSLRREPVGATSESSPLSDGHARLTSSTPSPCPVTQLVVLANEGGPLGIHVVPDYSPLGNELGLLVQGVEPGGRIHRDGRIAVQDRITEINGQPLQDVPFHCAQDLFRNALQVYILLIIELNNRIAHCWLSKVKFRVLIHFALRCTLRTSVSLFGFLFCLLVVFFCLGRKEI